LKYYLANCVEYLKTFAGFKNYGIPAKHFQVRSFPRPFLAQPEGSEVHARKGPDRERYRSKAFSLNCSTDFNTFTVIL